MSRISDKSNHKSNRINEFKNRKKHSLVVSVLKRAHIKMSSFNLNVIRFKTEGPIVGLLKVINTMVLNTDSFSQQTNGSVNELQQIVNDLALSLELNVTQIQPTDVVNRDDLKRCLIYNLRNLIGVVKDVLRDAVLPLTDPLPQIYNALQEFATESIRVLTDMDYSLEPGLSPMTTVTALGTP